MRNALSHDFDLLQRKHVFYSYLCFLKNLTRLVQTNVTSGELAVINFQGKIARLENARIVSSKLFFLKRTYSRLTIPSNIKTSMFSGLFNKIY